MSRRYSPYSSRFDPFSELDNPDYWTDTSSEGGKRKKLPELPPAESSDEDDSSDDGPSEGTDDEIIMFDSDEEIDPPPEVDPIFALEPDPGPVVQNPYTVQHDLPSSMDCYVWPDGKFGWTVLPGETSITVTYDTAYRGGRDRSFGFWADGTTLISGITETQDFFESIAYAQVANNVWSVTAKQAEEVGVVSFKLNFQVTSSYRKIFLSPVIYQQNERQRYIRRPNNRTTSVIEDWKKEECMDTSNCIVNVNGVVTQIGGYLSIGAGNDLYHTRERFFALITQGAVTIQPGLCKEIHDIWYPSTTFEQRIATNGSFLFKGIPHAIIETFPPQNVPSPAGMSKYIFWNVQMMVAYKIVATQTITGYHLAKARAVINEEDVTDPMYSMFDWSYERLLNQFIQDGISWKTIENLPITP